MEVHLWFNFTQTLLLYTWTNCESLHEPHSPRHGEASATRLLQSKRELGRKSGQAQETKLEAP